MGPLGPKPSRFLLMLQLDLPWKPWALYIFPFCWVPCNWQVPVRETALVPLLNLHRLDSRIPHCMLEKETGLVLPLNFHGLSKRNLHQNNTNRSQPNAILITWKNYTWQRVCTIDSFWTRRKWRDAGFKTQELRASKLSLLRIMKAASRQCSFWTVTRHCCCHRSKMLSAMLSWWWFPSNAWINVRVFTSIIWIVHFMLTAVDCLNFRCTLLNMILTSQLTFGFMMLPACRENMLEMLYANCRTGCTAFPGHWSEFPNVFGGEQAHPQNFPLV